VRPRIVPERFVAGGDAVVGLGRTEVRWLESGEIAHEGESAGAYWFRDGKIIRWQPFGTHTEALEAAGCGSRAPLLLWARSESVRPAGVNAHLEQATARDDLAL
jgi:hypothetical protein